MPSPLHIAILGTGAICDSHIQAYLKFPDRCRIVALCDLYPDKAAAKAAQHGLQASVYKDHRELIAREAFDAASVCLPPFGHAETAVGLLTAGKHVLVEKPMAPSLRECDAMIEASRAHNRLLSVVAQNRFKTPMMKIKRLLESGVIGRILHGQVDSFWWRGSNYYDLWWRGTWEKEGGGCTMNHAVHHVDLFLWMMGGPDAAQALTLNLAHENSEVEDFSTAVLTYANGSVGQITASLIHHGEEQQLSFQGERAKVAVPWQVKAMKQRENGFPEEDAGVVAEVEQAYGSQPGVAREGHEGQISNFLAAIDGQEPLLVDGVQGRRTIELITAIYESSQSGRRVPLPLDPGSPYYTREGILQHAPRFHQKTRSIENFAQNEITLGRNYGR